LAGDPRVAAVLAFGRLFEDDNLGAEIVGGDRGGDTRGTNLPYGLTRLPAKRDIAAER